jgi:5-methylcytosine-specific restriction endonuclease McrA
VNLFAKYPSSKIKKTPSFHPPRKQDACAERHLNIRAFSDNMKREAYERQNGICAKCEKHFELSEMEGDHVKPWREGGKTIAANCQMLCKDGNRRKSAK